MKCPRCKIGVMSIDRSTRHYKTFKTFNCSHCELKKDDWSRGDEKDFEYRLCFKNFKISWVISEDLGTWCEVQGYETSKGPYSNFETKCFKLLPFDITEQRLENIILLK